jgi:hypothetical protein
MLVKLETNEPIAHLLCEETGYVKEIAQFKILTTIRQDKAEGNIYSV